MAPSCRRSFSKVDPKKPGRKAANSPSTILPQTISKTQSFFIERLYNVPQRLGLSDVVMKIFKEYDDVKDGKEDEADFSRKLHLSPTLRTALHDTSIRCIEILDEKPEETPLCISIIKKCNELLKLSERPSARQQFEFMKLPLEIRRRIYAYNFGTSEAIRYRPAHFGCPSDSCPGDDIPGETSKRMDLSIAITCKAIHDEVLRLLLETKILSFSCTCKMLLALRSEVIRDNARSISFHWRGKDAHVSIPLLTKCPELKQLVVRVSGATTHYVSEREEMLQKFFLGNKKSIRMTDALGLDELLRVRGLDSVRVCNAVVRASSKRYECDVWHLGKLLGMELIKKKTQAYGEDVNLNDSKKLEIAWNKKMVSMREL